MPRLKILIAILIFLILAPAAAEAVSLPSSYPRLANYFLPWQITDAEVPQLAKWNVLILDMEVQNNSQEQLLKIRQLNPHIIILAYLTSEEILDNVSGYDGASLRQTLAAGLSDGWWLRDSSGNKLSNWPNTHMLNLTDGAKPNATGQRFNDYLPQFVVNNLESSGLWDGVFYDNLWGDISWLNPNLDWNNDGRSDAAAATDAAWAAGVKKMLAETRALAGPNFIIVGNGRVYNGYQSLINGMMLEDFPSAWESGGSWTGSMLTYLNLPGLNTKPSLPVINVYDKNQTDYRLMRFGLTSALLGDGFYSYDYDASNHGQTWWYDEYNVNLGPPNSAAFNLLAPASPDQLQPGLWRRDFLRGVALVNSTDKKQTYVFNKEVFDKIKGDQAPGINNGLKVNYIQLAPKDGILLLKRGQVITNSPFVNGYFYRIFNLEGDQVQTGLFSYAAAYPGQAAVIMASGSQDGNRSVSLSGANGQVSLYQDGHVFSSFYPFGSAYRGSLGLAARLTDGYVNTIVTGAGPGGGPQVQIFNPTGRRLGSFFAYDKALRGGVNVAIADLNGDGRLEIITGPGPGSEPWIKIFSLSGQLQSSWLAYGANFHGGVNVATGDLYGDGRSEIITGPASGGGPQVRVFSAAGKVLGGFFAYDTSYHGGISVAASDINNDGRTEILAGLKNFY